MCFLSCSLDSPPAPQFLSWGHSLPGALGAGRLVLLLCPPVPFHTVHCRGSSGGTPALHPPAPRPSHPPASHLGEPAACPRKVLWLGNASRTQRISAPRVPPGSASPLAPAGALGRRFLLPPLSASPRGGVQPRRGWWDISGPSSYLTAGSPVPTLC